ncbi:PspA-associated protein PspAA [Luteococcus peritonei]|uniref:PspA-associated domain-containing protein n=1 Tax=Luteococcus peritonei TaxID=88874 RepID=A0ABW4RRX4_9ACTN
MIIRILGEGQWRLDESAMDQLNQLDDRVAAAIEAGDQGAMQEALGRLLDQIRAGAEVADDELAESDLVVPDASATLDEVRALLEGTDEGLIPG